eukprot:scaffold49950_cov13-Tisochrysis_lutea.AAC.1
MRLLLLLQLKRGYPDLSARFEVHFSHPLSGFHSQKICPGKPGAFCCHTPSATHGGTTTQPSLTSGVNGSTLANGNSTPAEATKQQQQQQQQQQSQPARPGGLMLNGKRFLLVNTTLMLFKLLDEHVHMSTEVGSKAIKSTQLIMQPSASASMRHTNAH